MCKLQSAVIKPYFVCLSIYYLTFWSTANPERSGSFCVTVCHSIQVDERVSCRGVQKEKYRQINVPRLADIKPSIMILINLSTVSSLQFFCHASFSVL